ncbi:MAG: thioredoxin reductase (NADPH) [Myxococcota bacterium]|jgi:thioredoxin reductase (NADPH)
MRELVIIGSGPAGLTAAIYGARAEMHPLVLEGPEPGGQLTTTTDVENFPGFVDGIMGPDLMDVLRKQAQRFGSEHKYAMVTKVDFSGWPFRLEVDDEEWIETKTVIIATGASAKYLGLENEKKLLGHGVSACATCDGFFFRDKKLVVVGGGDTAMEEASFLTKFASEVTIVHRRDEFRASKIMQQRALDNDKIRVEWHSQVTDVFTETGKEVVGVELMDTRTGEKRRFDCDGMFLGIGHKPNTDIFKGHLELDDAGYIAANGTRTSVEGVFAAGDVSDKVYKQAITAAGMGCAALLDAEKWLEARGD